MSNTSTLLPPSTVQRVADWRRSFVADVTVRTLAYLRKTSTDEVRLELRGAVEPMKVGAFPGGSIAQLMVLADDTALAEILDLAFKIDMTGIASYNFVLPSNSTEAVFIEEGAPTPVASGLFNGMLMESPKKVALITPISNELENYSAPVASISISQLIRMAVGNGAVKVMLSTNPATAAAPGGILHDVPALPAGASPSKDIKALLSAISAAGISTRSVALIVASDVFGTFETQPWPLFKRKVIETPALAPGTIIAIAADGFVVAGEGVPVVNVGKGATLHLADPADQISVAGSPNAITAPVVSMFQTDCFSLRCVCRLNWLIAPGAVAWIQDASW